MITLVTVLTILYFVLSTVAAMKIGNWAWRTFYWDDVGVALVMIAFFWLVPLTAALDLGLIK